MLIDLIYKACEYPTFVLQGQRKIVQGLAYDHCGPIPAKDILGELGYTQMKVTRLMNLYYSQDEVNRAKVKLAERSDREHTSVSILTRNLEKTDQRSQGWCIQNITISRAIKGKTTEVTADVFYRSTELIQKFGADLSLVNRVFEDLEVEPSVTRFYFANAYVSAVFFPLLFQFTDGVKFLRHLKKHDPKFHELSCKAMSQFFRPVETYNYRTRRKQAIIAHSLDRTHLDEYLMRAIPDYHETRYKSLINERNP